MAPRPTRRTTERRAAAWQRSLLPGEQLVWTGAPAPGVHVRLVDLPTCVLGALFTGVSIAFVVDLFPFGLLLPHLWVGLYLLGGRFACEARVRAATSYAVTDRRALIVRSWPTLRTTSVELHGGTFTLLEQRGGLWRIELGASDRGFWDQRPAKAPAFEWIAGGPQVLAHLHRSDRAVGQAPAPVTSGRG